MMIWRELAWILPATLIPSALVAWAGGWLVRWFGPRLGLVDRPGPRKNHDRPMPTAGGLAIWLGIVGPLVVGQLLLWWLMAGGCPDFRPSENGTVPFGTLSNLPAFVVPHLPGLWHQSGKLWTMLAGGTVLMALGLWDDRRGLDWRLRLAVQTVVAVAMVAAGWRMTLFLDAPLITAGLSVVWFVWLINAFNMLDNMDGLSAGVAAIAAAILAAVMLAVPDPLSHQPHWFVGGFLLVFLGSVLGFLWHNRPPARLFMGDAGSYLLGFLLAAATLAATFAGGDLPRHSVLAPLCVLAIPLYDTASVILIRFCQGRSPFVGDTSHFSHRLVALGLTKSQAVLTIYLATATCGLGALLLHQLDRLGAAIVLVMILLILALVAILESAGRWNPDRRTKGKSDDRT